MQIDEHKLLVAALDGQIADEQAALEICGAYRPTERARQGDALRRRYLVPRRREQAAVDSAYRRPRNRDIGAGVVQRVNTVAADYVCALVNAVGARGIHVHLLKHHQIRGQYAQRVGDAVEVLFDGSLIGGGFLRAAIHKEVLVLTESCVANVPAQNGQLLARLKLR